MTPELFAGPAVSVHDLTVDRGDRTVLSGLTVEIARGEVHGLLGPSGCGKSTLMRAIVGTQIVRSGTVSVLGHPAGDAALRSRIGYMTQSGAVYGDLSARENLRFFASVLGAGAARVEEVLKAVNLGDTADRPVDRLSGGQRARVSLAAALLGRPELLVLDEPTVGLDPVLRRTLWAMFKHLAREQQVTLIVSSHVMDEARHCDRLILMRGGEILAQDTPAALLSRTGAADVEAAYLALVEEGAPV